MVTSTFMCPFNHAIFGYILYFRMVGGDVTVAWMNHKYVVICIRNELEEFIFTDLVKDMQMTTILTPKVSVLAEEEPALISMC